MSQASDYNFGSRASLGGHSLMTWPVKPILEQLANLFGDRQEHC